MEVDVTKGNWRHSSPFVRASNEVDKLDAPKVYFLGRRSWSSTSESIEYGVYVVDVGISLGVVSTVIFLVAVVVLTGMCGVAIFSYSRVVLSLSFDESS